LTCFIARSPGQQLARQGHHRLARGLAGAQRLQQPPLRVTVAGELREGRGQITGTEGCGGRLPVGVENLRRVTDDLAHGSREVAGDDGPADAVGVAEHPVALIAEAVRYAEVGKHAEDRLGPRRGVRLRLMNADAEAVAGQMAEPQLVAVQAGGEDAHPGELQPGHVLRAAQRDRDGLARDGAGVLETGVADVALRAAQGPGQLAQQLEGGEPGLLDRYVEMLPLTARFVKRNLLDQEVGRLPAQGAAGPGEHGGQVVTHSGFPGRRER
jgi:hypothetical protein